MNFFGTVLLKLGVEDAAPASYRAVISGGGYGYFENVKGIKSYSAEEIAFFLKKGELIVRGEKLGIERYGLGDAVVSGKILSFEVVGG